MKVRYDSLESSEDLRTLTTTQVQISDLFQRPNFSMYRIVFGIFQNPCDPYSMQHVQWNKNLFILNARTHKHLSFDEGTHKAIDETLWGLEKIYSKRSVGVRFDCIEIY